MVVLNEADAQVRAAQDVDAGVPGNPAKNDRQGRTVLAVAAALIVVAALVGWMFHGFALVRLVLPDTSAAAPSAPPRAQLKSASTAQQLYVWLAQVEAPLDALLVVRNNIAAAAANNDSAGIQRACESGQVIVPRVQEHLPSPDSALNTALQQTLDDYRFGFNECLVGVRYQDPAGIELAAVYLHRANEDLRVAMEVIARDLDDVESTDSAVVPV